MEWSWTVGAGEAVTMASILPVRQLPDTSVTTSGSGRRCMLANHHNVAGGRRMRAGIRSTLVPIMILLATGAVWPACLEAQDRGGRGNPAGPQTVTLSAQVKAQIGDFYSARAATEVQALPRGIRRRLERGKPLPPGIAKKSAPPELSSRLSLPEGFEIVEVGLDVLLVEVATDIVHDVLMDIIR